VTGYDAWRPSWCGGAAPHIGRGASDGQTKVTRGSGSLERLSDLPKGTQLMNGKGGIWNSAACLRNHSVSALICVNPRQIAHPSATSSGGYGIIDQDVSFFASFSSKDTLWSPSVHLAVSQM